MDERLLGEAVLLDEDLARIKLGAGGHGLEAWRYLLATSGARTRVIRATPNAHASPNHEFLALATWTIDTSR